MTLPTGQVDGMPSSTRPVTAAVVTGFLVLVAGVQLLVLVMVLDAWLGPAADDPHGYGVIFGVVVLVVTAPLTLLLLTLRRWLRSRR